MMNRSILFIFCLTIPVLIIPVNALEAQIDFHVSVAGNDVFHPGDDTTLGLLIENDGKLTSIPAGTNITQLSQMLTTVRDLSIEIIDVKGPILVKTVNPQFIGDIPAGRIFKVNFGIEVPSNVTPGTYKIPVKLKYTMISYIQDFSGVHLTYLKDLVYTKYITLKIEQKKYDFGIISIKSELMANQEGLVEIIVENTGNKELYDANLILNCSYPLKPSPSAMTAYIGDVGPGERKSAKFKVYVMNDVLNQTYPATLMLSFRTSSGIPRLMTRPVGLDVSDNRSFAISETESLITSPGTIPQQQQAQAIKEPIIPSYSQIRSPKTTGQGSASILNVPSRGYVAFSIKNIGKDINNAVAFLHFDDPSIQVENSPSLGYFKNGEVKHVLFYVKSTAPPGKYRGYIVLKYLNRLGDEEISKRYYVETDISPSSYLSVGRVSAENLGVGLKGSVIIGIKNNMDRPVDDVMFYIISPDPSIVPLSSSAFADRIDSGALRDIRFRLSVSDEASTGYYNLYLVEKFNAGNARDLVNIVEVPVSVGSKKVHFEVTSINSNLYPDKTGEIVLQLKNTGNMEIHNAVVRLEVNPPLSMVGGSAIGNMVGQTQPGLYFIGTLKPQEIATARFRVDVDKDAGTGSYPVVVRIEYYDDEGYSHISNPMTASVKVEERPLISPLIAGTIVISASGLILAGIFVRKRLKREREN